MHAPSRIFLPDLKHPVPLRREWFLHATKCFRIDPTTDLEGELIQT